MPLNFAVKLLVTAALTAGQMALTATQTIEGPRLSNLQATTANPGDPLPNGLGRVRNPGICFFAEPIKEKKKKHKTKGGKYKEYTYFGTFAIMIADHPIAGVRKVYFDNHLVYDATGGTVVSVGDGTDQVEALDGHNTTLASLMRIYDGTQTEPDPRMLAYVEALRGAGTCPAYLDVSYLFMEDMPLVKLGNRLPQVDVEYDGIGGEVGIVAGTSTIADDIVSDPDFDGFQPANFSPNGQYLVSNVFRGIATLDLSNNSFETAFDPGGTDTYAGMAIDNDGTVYALASGTTGTLYQLDDFGRTARVLLDNSATVLPTAASLRLFHVGADTKLVWSDGEPDGTPGLGSTDIQVYDKITDILTTVANPSDGVLVVQQILQDTYGDVWALSAEGTSLFLQRVVDTGAGSAAPDQFELAGLASSAVTSIEALFTASGLFVSWGGGTDLYLLDTADWSILQHRSYGSTGSFLNAPLTTGAPFLMGVPAGATEFWFPGPASFDAGRHDNVQKITAATLAAQATIPITDWPIGDTPDYNHGMVYSPYTVDKLISTDIDTLSASYSASVIRYFTTSVGLTLGDVARHFSGLVGLTAGSDYLVAAELDAIPVTGYGYTQGPAKASLDFLLPLDDCEVRSHDGIPQFIARGGAAGVSIDSSEFVIEEGQPQGRFKLPLANEADQPRRAVMTFADVDADLQPNTANAQRNQAAFDGRGELTLDGATRALDAAEADTKLKRWFRRQHFALQKSEQRVSCRHLAIEPGDIHPFVFDGLPILMHVDKVTDSADGSRHLECSIDDPALAALPAVAAGAPAAGRPPSEIFAPSPSVGEVLDLPLLSDADDQAAPFVNIYGAPSDPDLSYIGTEFSRSDTGDDDTYDVWSATDSSSPATFGATTSTLPNALPWVVDTGSTLTVVLTNGTLSSATLDQLLANARLNLALVGDELLQFRTATLTAPLTYSLSGFLRGARGTEQHMAGHVTGDRFVLMDTAIGKVTVGAGELGDEDWYIAATPGATPDPTDEFALDFNGNAHKPYSPAHVTVTRVGSDWEIDGIRRTRIGGASVNGQDVPLGETSESWEADIMDGADVVRVIDGTSLPLVYGSADSTIDFGSVPSSLTAVLYQISPALTLRGFGTEASG